MEWMNVHGFLQLLQTWMGAKHIDWAQSILLFISPSSHSLLAQETINTKMRLQIIQRIRSFHSFHPSISRKLIYWEWISRDKDTSCFLGKLKLTCPFRRKSSQRLRAMRSANPFVQKSFVAVVLMWESLHCVCIHFSLLIAQKVKKNIPIYINIIHFHPLYFSFSTPIFFCSLLSLQTEKYGSTDYKFCAFKSDGISFAAFHIIFFSSSYLIPLIMISGLYAFMLRLWRTVVPHNRTNESHRGRKRVTRLVFVVVAAFALLWLPIQVSSTKYA